MYETKNEERRTRRNREEGASKQVASVSAPLSFCFSHFMFYRAKAGTRAKNLHLKVKNGKTLQEQGRAALTSKANVKIKIK